MLISIETPTNLPQRKILTNPQLGIPGLALLGQVNFDAAGYPLATHIHPGCAEISLIVKGQQVFCQHGCKYTVNGGSVFISLPDEPHDTGNTAQNKIHMIWLQLDFREETLLGLDVNHSRLLRNKLMNINSCLIECSAFEITLLKEAFDSAYSGKLELTRAYIILFLERLLLNDHKSNRGASKEIIKAIEYIDKNIFEDIPLQTLADIAMLSLSRFKLRFKTEVGIPPNEYIIMHKVEKAKELLLEGKTITQAAFEFSFSSSNYFSTVFKKFTGCTPTEFIRSKGKTG